MSVLTLVAAPMMAPPDANGPAGFTTQWHGHGAGHQANNEPGDTAADRHGFENAAAGNSGHNPTAGSAQDDFSEETGLPMVAAKNVPMDEGTSDDDDDLMDLLL